MAAVQFLLLWSDWRNLLQDHVFCHRCVHIVVERLAQLITGSRVLSSVCTYCCGAIGATYYRITCSVISVYILLWSDWRNLLQDHVFCHQCVHIVVERLALLITGSRVLSSVCTYCCGAIGATYYRITCSVISVYMLWSEWRYFLLDQVVCHQCVDIVVERLVLLITGSRVLSSVCTYCCGAIGATYYRITSSVISVYILLWSDWRNLLQDHVFCHQCVHIVVERLALLITGSRVLSSVCTYCCSAGANNSAIMWNL
jgi:hypothetical protein